MAKHLNLIMDLKDTVNPSPAPGSNVNSNANATEHQGNEGNPLEETNDKQCLPHHDTKDLEQQHLIQNTDVIEKQPLKSTNADTPFYSATSELPSTLNSTESKDGSKKLENDGSSKRKINDSKSSSGCTECCTCCTQNTDAWCDCLAAVFCCMCLLK